MPNRMEEMASKGMGKAKAAKAVLKGLTGVFKQLSEEHGEAAMLLKLLVASSDPGKRAELFPKLRAELLAHERAEMEEVYPVLREYEATRDIADHHDHEAQQLEVALARLSDEPYDGSRWQSTLESLREIVEHHIRQEESEFFPKAQEVLGKERARELERSYTTAKGRILMEGIAGTRAPH